MRHLLTIAILLAGLGILAGCQRWGANDPPRLSDNPQIQSLRDARQNGLRTRCGECHASFPERDPGPLDGR